VTGLHNVAAAAGGLSLSNRTISGTVPAINVNGGGFGGFGGGGGGGGGGGRGGWFRQRRFRERRPELPRQLHHSSFDVAGVDLVIEGGEWLAIQGPTGHGKSTLLQILGGLDRPSAGIVDFDGRDLAQLREAEVTRVRATSVGFVFQTFNLVPTLSALENVEAALVPLHVSAAARRQQADEPTGNLDEDSRDEIIGLLEVMWRERGLTMVLVTHDSAVARRAQRIGVMKNGRLKFRQSAGTQQAQAQVARTQPAGDEFPAD
jgi:putative ABC transport system ATP-binding protein